MAWRVVTDFEAFVYECEKRGEVRGAIERCAGEEVRCFYEG